MPPLSEGGSTTVVIRAAGERTLGLCKRIVEQDVPPDRIHVVSQIPFSATLEECFAVGLAAGREWTLCVDADVLFVDGALTFAMRKAATLRAGSLGFSGMVHDWFYGRAKFRGFHLYRTELLPLCQEALSDTQSQLRPETGVKAILETRGHAWERCSFVYGLHDCGQFYRDIFRKMATRAQKNPEHVEHLLKRARRAGQHHRDFDVAAWGLRYGAQLGHGDPKLSVGQWAETIETLLRCNALPEKSPLDLMPHTAVLNRVLLPTRSYCRLPPSDSRPKFTSGVANKCFLILEELGLGSVGMRRTAEL